MNVTIVATKTCSHRALLEDRLRDLEVPYTVQFVEEHPEMVEQHDIDRSPNLLVDDRVVFRREANHPVPQPLELKTLLGVG